MAIIDPKNILSVTNLKEFNAFVLKYHCPEKPDSRAAYIIDWDKVAEDSYFGVAFTFPNVAALGITRGSGFENYQKTYWHSGYDVESLIVWDHEAYDHKLYPIEIYNPEFKN